MTILSAAVLLPLALTFSLVTLYASARGVLPAIVAWSAAGFVPSMTILYIVVERRSSLSWGSAGRS